MSIDVALFAVVGRDPERKTSHGDHTCESTQGAATATLRNG
jgi:hypothetical protein